MSIRKYKVTDLPNPDAVYTLMDLPLLIDCTDEQLDAAADMAVNSEMKIADYIVIRVE